MTIVHNSAAVVLYIKALESQFLIFNFVPSKILNSRA